MTKSALSETVVLRPFRFGGKDYKAGQGFPWRRIACSERRLRQLMDSRHVGLREEPEKPEKPAKPESLGNPEE